MAVETAALENNDGVGLSGTEGIASAHRYKLRTVGKDDGVEASSAEGVAGRQTAVGKDGAVVECDSTGISRRQAARTGKESHRPANTGSGSSSHINREWRGCINK